MVTKKIQEVVRPTRSPQQHWPPRRKKNDDFFIFFSQSSEQVVVRRDQIRRIGWVIKTLEAQVGQFLLGCKCPVSRAIVVQEQDPPCWSSRGVFPSKCPVVLLADYRIQAVATYTGLASNIWLTWDSGLWDTRGDTNKWGISVLRVCTSQWSLCIPVTHTQYPLQPSFLSDNYDTSHNHWWKGIKALPTAAITIKSAQTGFRLRQAAAVTEQS